MVNDASGISGSTHSCNDANEDFEELRAAVHGIGDKDIIVNSGEGRVSVTAFGCDSVRDDTIDDFAPDPTINAHFNNNDQISKEASNHKTINASNSNR